MKSSTKVMIDVEGGNNLLYLPLDKIMQQNQPATENTSPSAGAASAGNPSANSRRDRR